MRIVLLLTVLACRRDKAQEEEAPPVEVVSVPALSLALRPALVVPGPISDLVYSRAAPKAA